MSSARNGSESLESGPDSCFLLNMKWLSPLGLYLNIDESHARNLSQLLQTEVQCPPHASRNPGAPAGHLVSISPSKLIGALRRRPVEQLD